MREERRTADLCTCGVHGSAVIAPELSCIRMDDSQAHTDARWLRRAIALSREAREAGEEPFGSLLVSADGTVLAEARNTIISERDVSAHPELKLAVWAGRHLTPEEARATTLYTSCENCAMCSTAMVAANLGTLVYAMSGEALGRVKGEGQPSVSLSARGLLEHASYPVAVRGPLLEQEALEVQRGFWE